MDDPLDLKAGLARIAELDDATVEALNIQIADSLANHHEPKTPVGVAQLEALVAMGGVVRREFERRGRVADAVIAAAETAAAERVAAAETAEPVTASGKPTGKVARMAARQTKPKASPEMAEQGSRTALVASGNLRGGVLAGAELDRKKLALAVCDTLATRDRPQGGKGSRGQDVIVATARWGDQYPEERRLTGDLESDAEKWHAATEPDALVATGGICSPVNVDWTVDMVATADRPVRQGLPAFQASRGGLIYRPNLDFSAVTSGVGIWTQATDASPAGATKPIATISCPGTTTVYTQAVSYRLQFGNMMSRFDPETVAASMDAVLAAQARVAENSLLNLIAAACTQGITNTKALGATRDLLEALGQIVAGYRNLHRIPRSQALRACFPDWFKELLRIDLARETAHAQGDQWNSLAISDAQIESLFEPYGVTPIWHLDGQSTTAPGLGSSVNQFFTTQSTGAINAFPTQVVWYLWHEGAFQYLDGGTLDLGIVRDSLLDATNDWEAFSEVFETVAFRGWPGAAIQLTTALCASGGSAGTQNTQASTSTTCP